MHAPYWLHHGNKPAATYTTSTHALSLGWTAALVAACVAGAMLVQAILVVALLHLFPVGR